MKIVLLGYGKMGQLIERFAMKRGHEVVLIVDERNRNSIEPEDLEHADMAIDFSTPHAALDNISLCFEANLPLVVGTTGWYEHLDEVRKPAWKPIRPYYTVPTLVSVSISFSISTNCWLRPSIRINNTMCR